MMAGFLGYVELSRRKKTLRKIAFILA